MWGNPHDEYFAKAQDKKQTEMAKQRSRTASKPKRPTRPKRRYFYIETYLIYKKCNRNRKINNQ